ncbi:MAG: OmpA family protein [Hyphomonadaceae bacterium]
MYVLEIVYALLFVCSSGLLFNERFRKNWALVGISGLIALVSTYLLTMQIIDSMVSARVASASDAPDNNIDDQIAWRLARSQDTLESYGRYVEDFPNGKFISEARQRLAAVSRTAENDSASTIDDLSRTRNNDDPFPTPVAPPTTSDPIHVDNPAPNGAIGIQRVGDTIDLVMPADITFAKGSAALSQTFVPWLDKIAESLNQFPQTTVDIIGHDSTEGSEQASLALSLQRADAVRAYLQGKGVLPARMATGGAGELQPLIYPDDTEAKRAQNRRVVVTLRPVTQ